MDKLRYASTDEGVTIYLEGKVNAARAPYIEESIARILSQVGCTNVTLDASSLDYISSAGLRVVLRLLKTCERLSLANASSGVYDVFETTGITHIMRVTRRPRELSLDGLVQIGAGAFGRVYRLDDERVVKMYDPAVNPLDKVECEQRVAREAFVHGVPSAIPFETVRAGDEVGLVYELVNARTIGEVVSAHPAQARDYGRRMAELALLLHHTHFEEGTMPDARLIFHGWVDRAEKSGLYAPGTVERLRAFVDDIPEANTFVHGDFHPANIMVMDDGELTLIDMGDASVGDAVIDLAGTFHVLRIAAARPGGAKRLTGMPKELLDQLWDAFVRTYFGLSDDEGLGEVEARLRRFALPRTMGSIARSKLIDDETRRRQAAEAEQAFLAG